VLPLACSSGMAMRWRHLAPLGLVVALTGALSASAWLESGWLAAAVAGPYVAANLAASAHTAWKERNVATAWLMPVVFASLHFAYGFGSAWGCLRLAAALARPAATEPEVAS